MPSCVLAHLLTLGTPVHCIIQPSHTTKTLDLRNRQQHEHKNTFSANKLTSPNFHFYSYFSCKFSRRQSPPTKYESTTQQRTTRGLPSFPSFRLLEDRRSRARIKIFNKKKNFCLACLVTDFYTSSTPLNSLQGWRCGPPPPITWSTAQGRRLLKVTAPFWRGKITRTHAHNIAECWPQCIATHLSRMSFSCLTSSNKSKT